MRKIFVLECPGLTPELLNLLARVLLELGFETELLQLLDGSETASGESELDDPWKLGPDDVAFVILDDGLDAQERTVEAIRRLSGKGVRVVGIWPTRENTQAIPVAMDRYGAGAVPCEAEAIRGAVDGDENETWFMPDGSRRPDQPIKRWKC